MQGHFGERKNNRLINKKPLNQMRIKEKNQGKKTLVIIQFFKINLLLWPVIYRILTLSL